MVQQLRSTFPLRLLLMLFFSPLPLSLSLTHGFCYSYRVSTIRSSHQLFPASVGAFSLSASFFSQCTCHTSLNTLCHGALGAARMFSLLPRCMINYLILVQLGSRRLWSGCTLGDAGKGVCGGLKKKQKAKQKEWHMNRKSNAPDGRAVLLYRGLIPY